MINTQETWQGRLACKPRVIMTPIHQVLNRIRWDPEFGRGSFELGYFDRVLGRVLRVPLAAVGFPPDRPGCFEVVDAEGLRHVVPLHRVREVLRDGLRVWWR